MQNSAFADILIPQQGNILPASLFQINDAFLKQAQNIYPAKEALFQMCIIHGK